MMTFKVKLAWSSCMKYGVHLCLTILELIKICFKLPMFLKNDHEIWGKKLLNHYSNVLWDILTFCKREFLYCWIKKNCWTRHNSSPLWKSLLRKMSYFRICLLATEYIKAHFGIFMLISETPEVQDYPPLKR